MAISMKIRFLAVAGLAILPLAWSQSPNAVKPAATAPAPTVTAVTAATARATINQYCVVCHSEKLKKTGFPAAMAITLDDVDTADIEKDAEKWERGVHKVRAGMMPPSGMPRPNPAAFESLIAWFETELDKHAVSNIPAPGLHRLNRVEY